MFLSVSWCAEPMPQLCKLKVKVTLKGHGILLLGEGGGGGMAVLLLFCLPYNKIANIVIVDPKVFNLEYRQYILESLIEVQLVYSIQMMLAISHRKLPVDHISRSPEPQGIWLWAWDNLHVWWELQDLVYRIWLGVSNFILLFAVGG